MTAGQQRIKELEAEVAFLGNLVKDLLEKIEKLQNRKNSNNSSIPPSKDENRSRKTNSLRTPSGKKPGGQEGHIGTTLQMSNEPDIVIEHKPIICKGCGCAFSDQQVSFTGKRQVIDIPPIKAQYTEHRVYSALCTCGSLTKEKFPKGVKSPISYGSNIEALIAYLYSRQYIPSERMQEILCDVYGLPISEGTIFNILGRFANKSKPVYEAIREKIENSKVVGSDETGICINGKMNWGWTWQNKEATYIAISPNRGRKLLQTILKVAYQKQFLSMIVGNPILKAEHMHISYVWRTC